MTSLYSAGLFEGICKLLLQVCVARTPRVLRSEWSRRTRLLYSRGSHRLYAGSVRAQQYYTSTLILFIFVSNYVAGSVSPMDQLELAMKWNRTELFTNNPAYSLNTFNVRVRVYTYALHHSNLKLFNVLVNSKLFNDVRCIEKRTYGTHFWTGR